MGKNRWEYHDGSRLHDLRDTKVKLADTDEHFQDEYVTLSHRWGDTDRPVRLTNEKDKEFRAGIKLGSLPRTFQEAIHFAIRVDTRIRYIWIDSLCIRQGDDEDWLKESALMHKVYQNSFLNISATAAENSGEGLYSMREPQNLWEDVVRIDVDGLRKGGWDQRQSRSHNSSPYTVLDDMRVDENQMAQVQNCLLLDVANWETLVNQAPVNKRAWVVQERLLAPRVLHFCRGRIAWECAEFDRIEGHVPNMPSYQWIGDEIFEGVPIKGLQPEEHGRKLRHNKLRGLDDPLCPKDKNKKKNSMLIHSLELWARVMEMYSKTDLTQKKDKLIALSGIASQMATIIKKSTSEDPKYVSGLWDKHLISQLFWYVEPVRHSGWESAAGAFEFPSKRPAEYRAPSFSWASIDAQYGNGITYGQVLHPAGIDEITKQFELPYDEGSHDPRSDAEPWKQPMRANYRPDNKYGLVTGGHIRLWTHVYQVKLYHDRMHYFWCLGDRGPTQGVEGSGCSEKVVTEQHFNLSLDSPGDDDQGGKLTKSDQIYCVPVAIGPSNESDALVCLLLELVPPKNPQIKDWPPEYQKRTFRRIGLTKLTTVFDRNTLEYFLIRVQEKEGECDLLSQALHEEFFDENGRHLICII